MGLLSCMTGGNLTENSIKAVFQRIGTLEFWATSANPNIDVECLELPEEYKDRYKEKYSKAGGIYPAKIKRICQIMAAIDANALSKQRKPGDSDYYRATEEWVCINRKGEIYTKANQELKNWKPVEEPTLNLSHKINELNNAMDAALQGKGFDCHLAFDGVNFTPIPQLIYNEEKIQSIAKENRLIAHYLEQYQEGQTLLIRKRLDPQGTKAFIFLSTSFSWR